MDVGPGRPAVYRLVDAPGRRPGDHDPLNARAAYGCHPMDGTDRRYVHNVGIPWVDRERPDRIARGWACCDLRPRRSGAPRLRRRRRLARQIDAFERLLGVSGHTGDVPEAIAVDKDVANRVAFRMETLCHGFRGLERHFVFA